MENNVVSKEASKSIQNDLLDSILSIAQEKIKIEIDAADFIAIQVDETTDSSTITQMALIIRYVLDGYIYQRSFKFIRS